MVGEKASRSKYDVKLFFIEVYFKNTDIFNI